MEDYNIDFTKTMLAWIRQIENNTMNNFIINAIPEEQAKFTKRLLLAANKHGISTRTLIDVIQEASEQENGNETQM